MELYLLRHGRSARRSDWGGSDEERPLTEEGEGVLVHEAATLFRLGIRPDVVVASPLVRARQTAEIVARGMGIPEQVVIDDRVGEGFGAKRLRRVLRDHQGEDRIMLVGHEPDLSTIIRELTGARVVFSKGTLARVDVESADAKQGDLVWLLQAEILAGDTLAPAGAGDEHRTRPDDGSGREPTYDQPTTVAPTGERVPLLDEAHPSSSARLEELEEPGEAA